VKIALKYFFQCIEDKKRMKVQLSFNKILILKDISRYLPFLFRLKTQCACIIFVWKYIYIYFFFAQVHLNRCILDKYLSSTI